MLNGSRGGWRNWGEILHLCRMADDPGEITQEKSVHPRILTQKQGPGTQVPGPFANSLWNDGWSGNRCLLCVCLLPLCLQPALRGAGPHPPVGCDNLRRGGFGLSCKSGPDRANQVQQTGG